MPQAVIDPPRSRELSDHCSTSKPPRLDRDEKVNYSEKVFIQIPSVLVIVFIQNLLSLFTFCYALSCYVFESLLTFCSADNRGMLWISTRNKLTRLWKKMFLKRVTYDKVNFI